MESVKHSDASYLKVHEEISDTYSDEVDQEEELAILEHHEESVSKMLSLSSNDSLTSTLFMSPAWSSNKKMENLERKQEESSSNKPSLN